MKPIRFEGVYDPTIWKPVEGAEGYFVNMEGKIRGRRGKVLKGYIVNGYPSFTVSGTWIDICLYTELSPKLL